LANDKDITVIMILVVSFIFPPCLDCCKSKHRQAIFGIEYFNSRFKANFNKYFTISSAKEVDGNKETLLAGYSSLLDILKSVNFSFSEYGNFNIKVA
jgi:hypothetical protein